MKKILALCTACLFLVSMMACGMTNQQLQAEQAYYNMLTATRSGPQQPMVEIKIANPSLPVNIDYIRVHAPQNDKALPQYVQQNNDAAWINLLGTTISVALPWYGAFRMVDAVAGVIPKTGNTTTITTKGDGNKTQISGDLGITANSNTGNVTMPSTMANILDQTSIPTVVTQPTPIIHEPTVVQIPTQVITAPAITPAP